MNHTKNKTKICSETPNTHTNTHTRSSMVLMARKIWTVSWTWVRMNDIKWKIYEFTQTQALAHDLALCQCIHLRAHRRTWIMNEQRAQSQIHTAGITESGVPCAVKFFQKVFYGSPRIHVAYVWRRRRRPQQRSNAFYARTPREQLYHMPSKYHNIFNVFRKGHTCQQTRFDSCT